MIKKFGHIITGVCLILPIMTLGQNIDWEQSINSVNGGSAVAVENISAGYVLFGTGNNGQEVQSEWLRLDSLGQLDSARFIFDFDTAIFRSDAWDMLSVNGEQNFYISGSYLRDSGSQVIQVDFINKINEFGDTIWTFNYFPFAIFQSAQKLLSLEDKSVLSVGFQEQGGTQEDVFVRRLDSLGNVMWENLYPIPGNQRGYDLTEMLDGSLMISGQSGNSHLIIRIDFAGNIIDTFMYNISSGNPRLSDIQVYFQNQLLFSGYDFISGNNFQGEFILFDSLFNPVWIKQDIPGSWLFTVCEDSSTTRLQYSNGPPFIAGIARFIDNIEISSVLFPNDGNYRQMNHLKMIGNNQLLASGSIDNAPSQNYWVAKLDSVGEEWIPDRCAYQPPVAGFDYEYNYPVLTLRDTSSGGLKYLDTVYTWQWNTSVGTNGTDDSLVVFFDTAITKTIDIELVIGNWYGCTDTVNQTLVLGETGLEGYKELEVKVFPNPVKDILNVHIAEVQGDVLFSLYDLQGRLQFNQVLVSKNTTISISELPQGLYIYDLRTNAQVNRGKIVKK